MNENVPIHLSNLKSKVDKLDVDKQVLVPVDLSKLSDVVKNDAVKKMLSMILTNDINTSGFILKTTYDTGKTEIENKISDTSGLVKKKDYNTKITEIESKIPSISGLATNAVLTAIKSD